MIAKGWKDIFRFTYLQTLKSKAWRISTIIILLFVVLIILAMNFLTPILLETNKEQSNAELPGITAPLETEPIQSEPTKSEPTSNTDTTVPPGNTGTNTDNTDNIGNTDNTDNTDVPVISGDTEPPVSDGGTAVTTAPSSNGTQTMYRPSNDKTTLFILNQLDIKQYNSDLPADIAAKLAAIGFNAINVTEAQYNELLTEVKSSALPMAAVKVFRYDDGYQYIKDEYQILVSHPSDTTVLTESQYSAVAYYVKNAIQDAQLEVYGVDPNEYRKNNLNITAHYEVAGDGEISDVETFVNVTVPMLVAVLLFAFIITYGMLIAQSIALEKCSRVMELLLTSVRPLAVIVGKILAMGLAAVTQVILIIAVGAASLFASAPFGAFKYIFSDDLTATGDGDALDIVWLKKGLGDAFSGIEPIAIVWVILVFVLGFVFYSLIAGVIGATVNRSEDLQSAMQPLSFSALVGFFLAYYPSLFSMGSEKANLFEQISWYFPMSAPFALPGAYIVGRITDAQMGIAIVVLALCDLLLVFLISKVYEYVIVNTGNTMKLKDIAKVFKNRRATK
ncbi:MAG: ABC transporter permease [Oscillospiraceae bacterium]|jgi:ABC-2 type transport system permease protein|nr:ABC transporter permease [Oscillospiraceae bacterium]